MATSTDSVYRLYSWYLGQHSFAHKCKGNDPALMAKYPRLPQGEKPEVYEKQLEKIKFASIEKTGEQ